MQSSLAWITLFILVLSHQSTAQFLVEPCGTLFGNSDTNVGPLGVPWMAAISNSTHFLCGGTLIHRSFVLTAAHCIMQRGTLFVKLRAHIKTQYTATHALLHRAFSKSNLRNDIGLLKLSSSVVFDDRTYPICIDLGKGTKDHIEAKGTFKSIGWKAKKTGLELDEVEAVAVNQMNQTECQKPKNTICGALSYACLSANDSGNPLTNNIFFNCTSDREVQFGITSYGTLNGDEPVIFTDVTKYVDWIRETINIFYEEDTSVNTVRAEKPNLPCEDSVTQSPKTPPTQMVQEMWLYRDCGGDTIRSHLLAFIYETNFQANGVFVTDRFVITIARDLPENVYLAPMALNRTVYTSLQVDSIVRHPRYLEDNQNNLALLKLKGPVTIGDLKPMCVLTMKMFQQEAESTPPFTLFDVGETGESISIYEHDVELVNLGECSSRIRGTTGQNQLCIVDSPATNKTFGKRGDFLGKRMMYLGKEWLNLFGIVSYSTNGFHVLTNIMRYTEWMTQVVTVN
ncbi:polyserase-2-like [Drosophila rhopaloa]|uniref:Polyserase-2-like n=1 Tax=Drosophila rhopaloa TaxID=1041015 RepID=A0A6P4F6V0_DRORH|nr:polyserase-2-like [Drosophila rhopaloa]